jgi:hypothetical protein
MQRAVAKWIATHDAPFLMYFHVWELDPNQPRIRAAPLRERIRQYRNLDKMEEIVRHYLEHYEFGGVADYLGLPREKRGIAREIAGSDEVSAVHFDPERLRVSVVVPCFNEEIILPYLSNTLKSVERAIGGHYDLHFIFVDDGSTDGTWPALREVFGNRANCTLVRHGKNKGVAAAILTGIDAAESEVVCSIDCDCTYDPHQLETLIPMLTEDVDMVTASPYHQDGVVKNVPEWRLFLSKSLSRLYRLVLSHRLATYTSCFRVYRRSAVADLCLTEGGFLGVAEILGRLDLSGGVIVECPAVLEVRLLGRSKMKTLKTIFGHLRLLSRLTVRKVISSAAVISHRLPDDQNQDEPASSGTPPSGVNKEESPR